MAKPPKKMAKSGLLPIKFDAPGTRSLFYLEEENLLIVESPFADKENLKRLGGTWHPGEPKGWAWFFTIPNLEMLLDKIPFDFLDPRIGDITEQEVARIEELKKVKKAALKDHPISLRIPGISPPEGISLRNYQKLGVQFFTLVKYGLLLGDTMGLGKCASKNSRVCVKNIGSTTLEEIWDNYSDPNTSIKEGRGEWRKLSKIKVLGIKKQKSKYQKAINIYREKVRKIRSITLQDGSKIEVGLRHLFWNNENKWIKAKNLKIGDWILVPKIIPSCNSKEEINKNCAILLAWQIAEGHEYKSSTFTISQKERSILIKLRKIFKDLKFEENPNIHLIKEDRNHCSYLRITSKIYKNWLKKKFPDYCWGSLSGDKIIPEKITNSNESVAKAFIQHYFEAEGCCNKDNIELSSKSESIIRSMHYMLRRFGIVGVINNKTIYTPRWGNALYWRITIGGKYARIFKEKIGFISKRKNERLNKLCSKTENTNIANSIPCRHILRKLLKISDFTYNLSGIEYVHVSEKVIPQNPSTETVIKIIKTIKNVIKNGIPDITRSKWSARREAMKKNLKDNKKEIKETLKELESMIYEDYIWLQIQDIKEEKYNDYVYDFEISGESNYVVDLALGHNSMQSIAMALWRKKFNKAKKCLIVAPASVKYNWKEELEFWTNEDFVIVDGSPDKRDTLWNTDAFFIVVNPELIVRDFDDADVLRDDFDIIIVDEIHMLKNWKSTRSKVMKKLKLSENGIRIGLSGTPIDGKLEDLHSIFEFLVPGLFMTRGKFLDKYAIRNEWNAVVGYMNVDEVRKTIEPFFLRRLKEEVAKELPEKIFKNVYVELSTEERKIYNAIRNQAHKVTEEAEVITAVLRARQFCNAPFLVDEYPEFGSKFNACMELLEEVIANNNKVLVFSMFEQMVDRLYVEFEKNGWKTFKITGRVSKKKRPQIAKEFNEDPTVNICVMDEAGSTGLNFQEASYVLHYDDNWSPAIMKQRTDRAHRITTKHVVNVINFICLNTIEDHVRKVLKDKDVLSAAAIGDNVDQVCAIKSFGAKEALKYL